METQAQTSSARSNLPCNMDDKGANVDNIMKSTYRKPMQSPYRKSKQVPSESFSSTCSLEHVDFGPMRFAKKKKERRVEKQMDDLTKTELQTFYALQRRLDAKLARKKQEPLAPLTDELLLRYARSAGFEETEAWRALRKFNKAHTQNLLNIDAASCQEQLRSKTLFPLPGLRTRGGDELFYMKPSRFNPKETSTQAIIENLAYVLNCMLENDEGNSKRGVAFLANMNDWKFQHFSIEYCRKFMDILQGHQIPVRVNLFLIVNPPSWFDSIWALMKPMLSTQFQRKIHVIPEAELFEYLPFHYETHLPDDFDSGSAPTEQLVDDFVTYRLLVEKSKTKTAKFHVTDEDQLSSHSFESYESGNISCPPAPAASNHRNKLVRWRSTRNTNFPKSMKLKIKSRESVC